MILRPDDWDDWLTTTNAEAARAMLQLYPAEEMEAEAAHSRELFFILRRRSGGNR
ncbi:hypothetical protein [Burkholderia orbicola]|uniref:hypothetical protein n=1 Tax=Burkholderia orbicola TaxID=2978683 RepID=UPI00264D481F|nr:hypothetical protein [Burkholderia orbicola]MDN7582963.1 hypothetical protein [Burkholderia orbicola]